MIIGNTDLDANLLLELGRLGWHVEIADEDSEVYLTFGRMPTSAEEYMHALEIIGNLAADECQMQEGRLRLWWD